MSGHSKWHNIAQKKGKTDAQRAKIFTKLSREIIVAVKTGGANPDANSKLKDIIAKAKSNNVPADNIRRVIEKASGAGDSANYESVQYEGYGPKGTAIIVEAMTDNRNRTVSEVRHYFDKYGGNLGTTGSVSWMFEQKGVIVIEKNDLDEDVVMMHALDSGAADFSTEEEVFEIYTAPEDFADVVDKLSNLGYEFISAQVEMVPNNYIELTEEADIANMEKLLEMLDENDDVQNVWHNWDE